MRVKFYLSNVDKPATRGAARSVLACKLQRAAVAVSKFSVVHQIKRSRKYILSSTCNAIANFTLTIRKNFTIEDNFTCSLEQTSPYYFDVKSIGVANS